MLDIYPFVRYDNFLSKEDSDLIYEECQFRTSYIYGERDRPSLPPTGMVKKIEPGNLIYDLIVSKINEELIPNIEHPVSETRSYINMFHPKEFGYFHKDGHCLTYMYYPGDSSYDDDQDGYTIFDYGNITYAEKPIPNSLVRFYGNIRHKALPFRTENRYSVVTKYFFNDC
tara:strand:- start:227 stop:739 length:513 start_codon:yes stop_codon:yes gene_type:complete